MAAESDQELEQLLLQERPGDQALTYLDHAGAALPARSQLRNVFQELEANVMGNPHSAGSVASKTAELVDNARALTFDFFGAPAQEYDVIFTSGATAAIRLVAEYFPWSEDSIFAHAINSHTSVLGVRAVAPNTVALPTAAVEQGALGSPAEPATADCIEQNVHCLAAFPAECNFSGRRLPLTKQTFVNMKCNANEMVDKGHVVVASEKSRCREAASHRCWWTLLDAAKFAGSHKLDLSIFPRGSGPDFVCVSFYKIFGYPTGLGALIARKSALNILNKRYFGGGTVLAAIPMRNMTVFREEIHDRFEDGTLNYQSIVALKHGFETIAQFGGMDAIQRHTQALAFTLHRRLMELKHNNGRPLCEIYGWKDATPETQGATIAFNLQRPDGTPIGYAEVGKQAEFYRIQLRTGCFCNPGGCQEALGLETDELLQQLRSGHVCLDDVDIINGHHTGAVRASLGHMSHSKDVDRLVEFLTKEFLHVPAPVSPLVLHQSADIAPQTMHADGLHIEALYVYPIKSCAGMKVVSWPLRGRGLAFDREWAVVDASGRALRMKNATRMSQIYPVVDLRAGCLVVTASGMPQLLVPLEYEDGQLDPQQIKVCAARCLATSTSEECDQWFSTFLQMPCRLVRQLPTSTAVVQPSVKSSTDHRGGTTSFVNEQQFLVISRASVDQLSRVMQETIAAEGREPPTVSVEHFRPNVVIGGGAAHVEDHWHALNFGSIRLVCKGPCGRCSMVNIDPKTGAIDARTLQTLSGYRRDQSQIFFGQFFGYDEPSQAVTSSFDAGADTNTQSFRIVGPLLLKVGQQADAEHNNALGGNEI